MPQFDTIEDIKTANAVGGGHWFEPATMRFFSSHVSGEVYPFPGGATFVSSERYDARSPRRYTVRVATVDGGHVGTVGEFQGYATLRAARKAAQAYAAAQV